MSSQDVECGVTQQEDARRCHQMQLKMKVVVGWLTDTLSTIQRVRRALRYNYLGSAVQLSRTDRAAEQARYDVVRGALISSISFPPLQPQVVTCVSMTMTSTLLWCATTLGRPSQPPTPRATSP
jgi:hypothetical protein